MQSQAHLTPNNPLFLAEEADVVSDMHWDPYHSSLMVHKVTLPL